MEFFIRMIIQFGINAFVVLSVCGLVSQCGWPIYIVSGFEIFVGFVIGFLFVVANAFIYSFIKRKFDNI